MVLNSQSHSPSFDTVFKFSQFESWNNLFCFFFVASSVLPNVANFRQMGDFWGCLGYRKLQKLAIWRFLTQLLPNKNAIKSTLAIKSPFWWQICESFAKFSSEELATLRVVLSPSTAINFDLKFSTTSFKNGNISFNVIIFNNCALKNMVHK